MAEQGNGASPDVLPTVATLLHDAAQRMNRLLGDDLIVRLFRIVAQIPAEDREILLGLLEREVQARLLTDAAADALTGLSLRPNPNARLYVRVVDNTPAPENEKIVLASTRAMRLVGQVVGPMRERWKRAMLASLKQLDPAEQEGVIAFCRDVLDLVEEAKHS
jgi:hypothetical protein